MTNFSYTKRQFFLWS